MANFFSDIAQKFKIIPEMLSQFEKTRQSQEVEKQTAERLKQAEQPPKKEEAVLTTGNIFQDIANQYKLAKPTGPIAQPGSQLEKILESSKKMGEQIQEKIGKPLAETVVEKAPPVVMEALTIPSKIAGGVVAGTLKPDTGNFFQDIADTFKLSNIKKQPYLSEVVEKKVKETPYIGKVPFIAPVAGFLSEMLLPPYGIGGETKFVNKLAQTTEKSAVKKILTEGIKDITEQETENLATKIAPITDKKIIQRELGLFVKGKEVPILKELEPQVAAPKISPKILEIKYKDIDEIAEALKEKDLTMEKLTELRVNLAMTEEMIDTLPAKQLAKYVSKTTGRFPEVTGKPTSLFAQKGDDIITELGFKNSEEARDAFDVYSKNKQRIGELKTKIRPLRERYSTVLKGEKLMTIARQDRRLAFRALKGRYNLTDAELAKIRGGRDLSMMEKTEFTDFMQKAENLAEDMEARGIARTQLEATIYEKEFRKVENLQQAMKLPKIENMTIDQLTQFDKTLQQFKQGDEFLGVRQLETVKNTELSEIKTIREAREKLAEQIKKSTGKEVSIEELSNIKINELDRFRYDTALARQNPFFELMVKEKNIAQINSEASFYKIKEKLNILIDSARKSRPRSITERFIPTDKQIFKWLEATDAEKIILSKSMTEEELTAVKYIRGLYAEARDYLVQHEVLKKYRSDYITHIRRGFLEGWKEDGLLNAFKEVFQKYKQDEAMFNILNEKTGNILPLEKFFQFSMKRSGVLEPTKNVSSAVQAYFKTLERKKALDALVPKLDIYAHSLTPKKLTPRGLEFDDSLKRFVKEWLNTKKGRVADTMIVKPGGKIDWTLRTGIALTRILDLGLSIPVGLASTFGEQAATFVGIGAKKYTLGIKRLATKQGIEITNTYKNFIGEKLLERLTDTSKGLGDKTGEAMFSLFSASTRKANQIFLLGQMTSEEFARGALTAERLAELQTKMGRYRVVENFESIIGKTAPGKVFTQYRSWAVPLLSSTIDNISTVSKMIRSGDKAVFKSDNFKELIRTIILSGTLGLGLYGFLKEERNKKDRTFLENIAFKSAQDSLSLIGALDPSLWTTIPRLLSFLNNLAISAKQIILIEEAKKGAIKLQKTITPSAIKQFQGGAKEKESEGLPVLPKLPSLPELPKLPKL